MSEDEIREEIVDVTEPDGLMTPKRGAPGPEAIDTTGNGLKYFCMYHVMLVNLGMSRPADLESFERVVRNCYLPGTKILCRSRTKGTTEQTAKDDYIWVVYAAMKLKSPIAWELLNEGNVRHFGVLKWFYKNVNPGVFPLFKLDTWKAWFGKNPEVIAHLQWCGLPPGEEPHFIRVLWQAIYLCVASAKRSDLVTINYAIADASREKSRLIDVAAHIWEWRMYRRWPEGMKQVLADELEPTHPIARSWR